MTQTRFWFGATVTQTRVWFRVMFKLKTRISNANLPRKSKSPFGANVKPKVCKKEEERLSLLKVCLLKQPFLLPVLHFERAWALLVSGFVRVDF